MGINQIEELNQKRFKKRQEVELFLNNLNTITRDRVFNFNIEDTIFELRGLIDKFSRDTIKISIFSEVSSGKSTFLNTLVFNKPILESKIGETTAKIFHIKYGDRYSINGIEKDTLLEIKEQIAIENRKNLDRMMENQNLTETQSVITLPHENLKKGIELYDTPGFASIKEKKILTMLKEVVSQSDATILLLDISQGIKESERLFIKTILHNIQTNKRFIVLNKYDSIISEDDLIIKSKEEINQEITMLIENIESTLQMLQDDSTKKINSFYLSAKKALVGKIQNDALKLEQSRFPIFEEVFWKRVTEAKDEVFTENIKAFKRAKYNVNEMLKKERESLQIKRNRLEVKRASSMNNQRKILILEKDIERLNQLKSRSKKRRENLISQEPIVRENIRYILNVNLASELSTITFFQKLRFWSLKKRYQRDVVAVIKDASSYIIELLNPFVLNSIKERKELETILWSINKNTTHLLVPPKYAKTINLEEIIKRVIDKMENYIAWDRATLFALLKYNISTKNSEPLEPSYVELMREISDMTRILSNEITNRKPQIENYISMVENEIERIKQSKEEQESLEQEIKEVTAFIEDIDSWGSKIKSIGIKV